MAKKKHKGPNFWAETQARMAEEDKDRLWFNIIRRRQVFEEALHRLPVGALMEELDKYRLLLRACHNLAEKSKAKPGTKKFKSLLKDEVRKLAQEHDNDELIVGAAEEVAGEGGFIDEAYETDKADLSDALGRKLLQRYLYETEVIGPLYTLVSECGEGHVPKNLPQVLEKLQERIRKQESIESKTIKTFEDEWEEHEERLQKYRGKQMIGLKTGLAELDKRTLGLRGLFILGAKPGAGKTTFAGVAIAIGVCRYHADNDCVVVVVCLDIDRFELYRRQHCHLGDVEWATLMFGSPEEMRESGSMFSKADNKRLKKAEERFHDWEVGKRLSVPDRTVLGDDITDHRLSAIIEEKKAKVGAKRALIIVDYLQLLPVPEEEMARGDLAADKYRVRLVQQVIERSRTADNPTGDTALVISEARKPPTRRGIWGDSMSELMGSARLGYAGDAVLLYREMSAKEMGTYYGVKEKQAAEKKKALLSDGIVPVTLILDKGRDGMTRGTWGVEFFYRKSTFRELTPNQHKLAYAPPSPDEPDEDAEPGAADNGAAAGHLPLPPPGNGFTAKGKKKGKKKKVVASPKSASENGSKAGKNSKKNAK